MASRKKTKGLRRKGSKWQAYTRIAGRLVTKAFDTEPTELELATWRAQQRDLHGGTAPAAGSFAADVEAYLARIAAQPTVSQKAAHLALWVGALGGARPSRSITAAEVDAVMQTWLLTPTVPPPGVKHGGRPSGPDGLAPGTVRKRRTSLQSFFVKMFGKSAATPTRGTSLPKPPEPAPVGRDYLTIRRLLDAMPDTRSHQPGAVVRPSLSRLRAAVIAYTGLPPGMLGAVQPSDLNLDAATLRVVPRLKGGGVSGRVLELMPEGVEALRAFHQAGAYGPFPSSPLNQSVKRAAARVGIVAGTFTLYHLRHSFGEQLYRSTRDTATVGRLMVHAEGSTVTSRYTKGAHAEVNRAAVAAFSQDIASSAVRPRDNGERRQKLPAKVARHRNSHPVRRLA
jgi:integrase